MEGMLELFVPGLFKNKYKKFYCIISAETKTLTLRKRSYDG